MTKFNATNLIVWGGAYRPGGPTWIFTENHFAVPPGEWVDHEFRSYSCYFWTFQIELDRIDTKNFENGSVLEKLQTSKVGEHFIKFMKFKPKFNENPPFVFTQW